MDTPVAFLQGLFEDLIKKSNKDLIKMRVLLKASSKPPISSRWESITEWLRLEAASGGHLVQLPCSSSAAHGQLLRHLNAFKEGESTTTLDSLCQCTINLIVKKVFWNVQTEHSVFQFVPIASAPVSGHHWKEPGLVSFAPSPQDFVHIDELCQCLLFSGWTVSDFSTFPHTERVLHLPNIFSGFSQDSF